MSSGMMTQLLQSRMGSGGQSRTPILDMMMHGAGGSGEFPPPPLPQAQAPATQTGGMFPPAPGGSTGYDPFAEQGPWGDIMQRIVQHPPNPTVGTSGPTPELADPHINMPPQIGSPQEPYGPGGPQNPRQASRGGMDPRLKAQVPQPAGPSGAMTGGRGDAQLGGGAGSDTLQGQHNDIAQGIIDTAHAIGADPLDLATAISFETGGTFDPRKAGGVTKYGRMRGLIQFGEPQAKQYGVDWSNPVGSQLGPNGAVAKYMKASGFKPGMGMGDLYSTINAGGPGRHGAMDNGSSVAQKVAGMGAHRKKAEALLAGKYTPGPASGMAASVATGAATGGLSDIIAQATARAASGANGGPWGGGGTTASPPPQVQQAAQQMATTGSMESLRSLSKADRLAALKHYIELGKGLTVDQGAGNGPMGATPHTIAAVRM